MVYLQTTYELCFGEASFEYFESCDFSRENANIDVSATRKMTIFFTPRPLYDGIMFLMACDVYVIWM
jgi:hypothetical protein